MERLRLGTSFLFHEIARIGKTRADKRDEGRRTTERRTRRKREGERERMIYCSRSVADEKRGDASGENYVLRDHVSLSVCVRRSICRVHTSTMFRLLKKGKERGGGERERK